VTAPSRWIAPFQRLAGKRAWSLALVLAVPAGAQLICKAPAGCEQAVTADERVELEVGIGTLGDGAKVEFQLRSGALKENHVLTTIATAEAGVVRFFFQASGTLLPAYVVARAVEDGNGDTPRDACVVEFRIVKNPAKPNALRFRSAPTISWRVGLQRESALELTTTDETECEESRMLRARFGARSGRRTGCGAGPS
jgi:hypothetical protein